MVTGDASNTAVAIAKQVALVSHATNIDVLTDYLRGSGSDHRHSSELMNSKATNAAVVVRLYISTSVHLYARMSSDYFLVSCSSLHVHQWLFISC